MWMMLQHSSPQDFVVATGSSHSVQEFLELAAEYADVDWKRHVALDPRYLRPTEVDYLKGMHRGRRELGWQPKIFEELVR